MNNTFVRISICGAESALGRAITVATDIHHNSLGLRVAFDASISTGSRTGYLHLSWLEAARSHALH